MPMVVSNKQRIHYRFEGERGAFMLLHHGLFGSHQDWYDAGFVELLSADFRLIIPDARGHGRSDRPDDPAEYSLKQMADDVIAIMDELGVRNLHFLGYSLGALVGFELLQNHPERMRIVMLGGESPVVTEEAQARWGGLAKRLEQESLAALLDSLRAEQRLVRTEQSVDEALEHDPALALLRAMSAWEVNPAERIPVRSPLILFSAVNDPLLSAVQRMNRVVPRSRFVSFSDTDHASLFFSHELLMGELTPFMRSGRKGGDASAGAQRSRGGDDTRRGSGREDAEPERTEGDAGTADDPTPAEAESSQKAQAEADNATATETPGNGGSAANEEDGRATVPDDGSTTG